MEAMVIETCMMIKVLHCLWQETSEIKHIEKDWATWKIFTLSRKRCPVYPEGFRPQAILSNGVKAIGALISTELKHNHRCSLTLIGLKDNVP